MSFQAAPASRGPLDKSRNRGDFVIHADAQVAFDSVSVENDGAIPWVIPPGYPFVVATGAPVLTTAEATTTGQYVGPGITLQVGDIVQLPMLVRGPALLNESEMPILDVNGAVLVPATAAAAMVAIDATLKFATEPPTQEVQTT